MRQKSLILWGILIVAASVSLAGDGFNSSIEIRDGEVRDEGLSALNGQIRIGDNATVNGLAQSVNGSIRVGTDSRVRGLNSVNGSIEVKDGTVIDGDVAAVNGRISLGRVQSTDVSTVNGSIDLDGSEVDGDVRTVNGNISLDGATVTGSIVIEDRGRNSSKRDRPIRIELEGGSVVGGDIINEDSNTKVEVYLRDGSSVQGRIENAEIIEG